MLATLLTQAVDEVYFLLTENRSMIPTEQKINNLRHDGVRGNILSAAERFFIFKRFAYYFGFLFTIVMNLSNSYFL